MNTWKVEPDPVHRGKHALHDSRYIMTSDAEVEFSPYVPNEWRLAKGSIICQMTDIGGQAEIARLMAAAPELDAYRKYIEENLERIEAGGWTPVCFAEFCTCELAEADEKLKPVTYGGMEVNKRDIKNLTEFHGRANHA